MDYDVIERVAKRKQKARYSLWVGKWNSSQGRQPPGGQMSKGQPEGGGQTSAVHRNPTASWGCPFMLQKGYFLAIRMDSNVVMNLLADTLFIPQRGSLQRWAVKGREKDVFSAHTYCAHQSPLRNFPLHLLWDSGRQAELPMQERDETQWSWGKSH